MALGVGGVRVGVWTDPEHHTGCTVILPPAGTVGGIAVRGGAPGTRESAILGPATPNEACHGVVLCGSSLFGLRAADGVVDWCEAQGIGLDLIAGRFPIVGAAVVLDIRGPNMRRIDREAGWAACEAATADEPVNGSVGVGTGCTVGKEAGVEWSSKGGQGSAVRRSGDVTVGAIVAVNALGSVLGEDGRIIAGCRAPDDHPRYPHAPMSVLRSQGRHGVHVAFVRFTTPARRSQKSDGCSRRRSMMALARDPAHPAVLEACADDVLGTTPVATRRSGSSLPVVGEARRSFGPPRKFRPPTITRPRPSGPRAASWPIVRRSRSRG